MIVQGISLTEIGNRLSLSVKTISTYRTRLLAKLGVDSNAELPEEREFVASIDTFKTSRKAPPLALTDEQIKALPVPEKPAATPAEAIGPTRSYPPLEAAR